MFTLTAVPIERSPTARRSVPSPERASAIPVTASPARYIHAPTHTAPDVPTVPRGDGAPIVQDPRLDEAAARLARLTVRVSAAARLVRAGYLPYTTTLASAAQERVPGRLPRWRTTMDALARRASALWRRLTRADAPHERPERRSRGERQYGTPLA